MRIQPFGARDNPQRMRLLGLVCFSLFWASASASLCVVSKWRPWGACVGTCGFALRVRNRDVLQAPLPERDAETNITRIPECPTLYETERCLLQECIQTKSDPMQRQATFKKTTSHPAKSAFNRAQFNCTSDNESCCRLTRYVCPDGQKPTKLIRWYHMPSEPFCRPYRYPYCGPALESVEKPMSSEKDCAQMCVPPKDQLSRPEFRPI